MVLKKNNLVKDQPRQSLTKLQSMAKKSQRKPGRPKIYSNNEMKEKQKARRQRDRRSSVQLLSAHRRWQQLKDAGGWTHSELALHLIDTHDRFCGTDCSAKRVISISNPFSNSERSATSNNEPNCSQSRLVSHKPTREPASKIRIPRLKPSVPVAVPANGTSTQSLSNSNMTTTTGAVVVVPADLQMARIEPLNVANLEPTVCTLQGDVKSFGNNKLEIKTEEISSPQENHEDSKHSSHAIGDELEGEEDVALIVVATPGEGDDGDEG